MQGNLIADYAAAGTVATHVNTAASRFDGLTEIRDASWTGSAAVAGAVVESSRLRAVRVRVVSDALLLRANGVRDAVSAMIDADTAAANAVTAR